MVPGSVQWLIALRDGAFANRHPVPQVPKPAQAPPRSAISTFPLAEHHGNPCPYCSEPMLIGTAKPPTREHKHPKSKGGSFEGANREIVCGKCNNDKGSMTLEQFGHWLIARGDGRASVVWDYIEMHGIGGPDVIRRENATARSSGLGR